MSNPAADLSDNWKRSEMALRQREIVDAQLAALREGRPPKHFRVFGEMLQRLQTLLDVPECSLLDAGCASAYYYDIIERYVPGWIRYTGCDYSSTMLELARAAHPDIAVSYGDICNLGFESNAYDIVLSGAVIMHIRNWEMALAELMRVTKRILILHRTWVYADETSTSMRREPSYDGIPVWFISINERDLIDRVRAGGLEPIIQTESGESSRGLSHVVKSYVFQRDHG